MMAACLLVIAFSYPAKADTVTADLQSVTPGTTVDITFGGYPFSGISAGYFNWANVTPSNTFLGASFRSFCIQFDVGALVHSTFTTVDLEPRFNSLTANRLREFWGRYFGSVGEDANLATAFQLGLWEIVHETKGFLDLSTGNFIVDSAAAGVKNTAQNWLNSLDGTGPLDTTLVVLDSPNSQDQIINRVPPIIPAPPAVILGAMGLVSLIGYGAGRRRNAKLNSEPDRGSTV
jgi:hypothetical protein